MAQAEQVEKVLVAPGNAGTARDAKLENVALDVNDQTGLADLAEREGVALTIVGPEAPLVDGLVDYFQSRGLKCFGPGKAAGLLYHFDIALGLELLPASGKYVCVCSGGPSPAASSRRRGRSSLQPSTP